MDDFYKKLETMLREHKQLFGGEEFITPEVLLETVGDALEELAEISKDHARLECLANAVTENKEVKIDDFPNGSVCVRVIRTNGAEFSYSSPSLVDAIDNMHKGEHE